MKNVILTLSIFLFFSVLTVPAQTSASDADREAIKQTALDYIEGWYEGNPERMERALHPELAKRIVRSDTLGNFRLDNQSAMTLVQNTQRGGGKDTPADKRRDEVKILDIYESAASVRVRASSWVDYLHIAKSNGRWVIVNVLWEMDPAAMQQGR